MPQKAPASLAKRLSLSTSLSTLVLTLAALGLTFALLTKAGDDKIHEQGAHRLAFLVQAMETPLWSLDALTMGSILEAVTQDQNVAFLTVTDVGGDVLFHHDSGLDLVFDQTRPILHHGQELGTLRLGMVDSHRGQMLRGLLLPAMGLMLFGILVQLLTMRMLLRPMLARAFDGLNAMVAAFRTGDFSARPATAPDREFVPLVDLLEDMGATIEAQLRSLRAGEEHLRDIFDGMSEAIFVQDPETGKILQTNHRMQELFGYTEDEALRASVGELSVEGTEYSAEAAMEHIRRAAAGDRHRFLWLSKNKQGNTFWTEVTLQAAMIGGRLRVLASVRDITAHKNAEDELRRQRHLLERIINTLPLGVFWKDQRGAFMGCNEHFAKAVGARSPQELIGKTDYDLGFPIKEIEGYTAHDRMVLEGGQTIMHITEPLHTTNGLIWLDTSKVPLEDESGAVYGVLGVFEDITERKSAEERLRQSEEKFSQLFHLSPEAIALIDMQTRTLVDANQAFTHLTGFSHEEVLGKNIAELSFLPDIDRRRMLFDQLQTQGHAENFELKLQRKDGRASLCSLACTVLNLSGKPTILAMARDITELKRMQEMMVQTEKMVSVGGIAAGIAHEINNPLGIVLQAAQNLAQRLRPDFCKNVDVAQRLGLDLELVHSYAKERKLDLFLEDIQVAATRASNIIRHMLDFSRRSESRRCLCKLPAIIDKAVELASSDYDLKKSYDFKRIQIERDIAPHLPGINCTETEIEQVLLNLLRNAAQAMGTVQPPLEAPRINIRAWASIDAVHVEVCDNGPGMSQAVQRRIFEPFFTTKPPGVGTGLGLSVSYFIVTKGHGGSLTVSSCPGQGACFTLLLPLEGPLLAELNLPTQGARQEPGTCKADDKD
ncbi:PAS domain S-box protein [Humidesulfovibrio sp.]